MAARDTALSALIAGRRLNAWSDGILKEYIARDKLDRREAALASRLCYGVLQNRMLLDEWIGRFLKGKLSDLQPVIPDILRLGTYQLTFMDKIPANAAVNEAVEQAKRLANRKAAGLVNGLLRSMDRNRSLLSFPEDPSLRYSHPEPLYKLLRDNLGEDKAIRFLESDNEAPSTCIQTNTLRINSAELRSMLENEGFRVEKHPWLHDCLTIQGGSVEHCAAFQNGLFYVQDPAARLAVLCADLQPGMRVLDCCSAPGGKSLAAALCMKDDGEIIACDLYPHKISLIEKNVERLGVSSISALQSDATVHREDWNGQFDAVLADLPCSGLGVIRKKPDIRYKDLTLTEQLPKLQRSILDNQASYVKPGGVLLYSTCTVLKRENEAVAESFLAAHSEFVCEQPVLPPMLKKDGKMLTLLPCEDDCDGFFICKLRRLS